jgi:isoaspartyl peptidase/L-asparaginase-like protein (Ntn-hydrolase superfamily)
VVHGGAGAFEDGEAEEKREIEGLLAAAAAGFEVLAGGGPALTAVVEAVASMEDGAVFNAGRGAVPATDGSVELDASVMDGASGAVGAVCASRYPANPVRAARAVAELGRLPEGPVLLAGSGADEFCRQRGLVEMRPEWLKAVAGRPRRRPPGTVGAVALDEGGAVAAATSTGGRSGQLPGRVGDSPIPGAGVLARRSLAVSATGAGEAFLVAGFAHRVAFLSEGGAQLADAVKASLASVADLGGEGGAIAISPDGEFVAAFSSSAMARAWRDPSGATARVF